MSQDIHNQQTSTSGQSHGTYTLVKSNQIELQVPNILTQQDNEFPKVPQTRKSEKLFCSKCNLPVDTDVSYVMGKGSYIFVILLLVFLLTALFAFIPCLLNRCKDAQHRCSKCTKILGTKQFLLG